jgi:putative acetyltransferase
MNPPVIREEKPGDAAAIRNVLVAAFPTKAEADLVEALRGGRDVVLSMIAVVGELTVGSIVFSRLTLNGFTTTRIVALAPLAVHPDFQRQDVSLALLRSGHRELAQRGVALSFVLGDPDYYGRYGYSLQEAAAFKTPYDGPHLMALRLSAAAPRDGEIAYPPAFAKLS